LTNTPFSGAAKAEAALNALSDSLDAAALHDRYQAERAKRLRPEANAQYRPPEGGLARFVDDPYADSTFSRAPLREVVDVLVVGGGFGGLMISRKLLAAGVTDFRIVEKAADFGGTWYWNRYPGAACDIESYIYLPFLEDVGYMPSEKYAKGPEIFEHCRRLGRYFGLYEKAIFQTEITGMRWEDDKSRWVVATNRGDVIEARFVAMSAGPLHRPKLPGIPGIETFKGHAFHTSRWDYAYTGGDHRGGLTGLSDKRVGVIGTGATGVQCIPHLAGSARELYVFQRTPSAVGVRDNAPTDPAWWDTLQPGWQHRRMENFTNVLAGAETAEDLVDDGWTYLANRIAGSGGEAASRRQLADYAKMELIRRRVDEVVRDGGTAEALKPYYNVWCKRPCFHDSYLQTFNRPNVTLVDTQGRGVERFTGTAAIVEGRAYELDCLVLATGFEFQTDYARRTGYEIYGRGGTRLSEKWRGGVSTLHGVQTHGFPNCLIISTSQQAVTANFTHMFDEISSHIAYIVGRCLKEGVRQVEPSQDAEERWVEHIMALAEPRRRFEEDCTPGFYNNEGAPTAISLRNGSYAGPPPRFMQILREWRAAGDMAGLEIIAS
jgi:cyclohexanone monooxygenase